MQQDIYQSY